MHLHPLGRLFLGCLLALPGLATAQTFSSGSTEADGPFNPPASVPPGTTVSGSTYTVPLPPSGVFHFTTISLPSGTAVKFAKNASNTPVILLASGNVTIAGILDVNGASATTYGRPGQGGPGGFSGGPGADGGFTSWYGTPGLGPGGGGMAYKAPGAGGGFGTAGTAGTCYAGSYDCAGAGTAAAGPAYGSPTLRPILGGSGGAGGYGV
ncbi:MAG: hypothetical protein HY712_02730, partial [candidate division NC10 bacterium]|nr:hypothetical protein [candidate division NC10 bacterium]